MYFDLILDYIDLIRMFIQNKKTAKKAYKGLIILYEFKTFPEVVCNVQLCRKSELTYSLDFIPFHSTAISIKILWAYRSSCGFHHEIWCHSGFLSSSSFPLIYWKSYNPSVIRSWECTKSVLLLSFPHMFIALCIPTCSLILS